MRKYIFIVGTAIALLAVFALSQTRKNRFDVLEDKIIQAVNQNQRLISFHEETPEAKLIIAEGDTVLRALSVTAGEKTRIRAAIKTNLDSIAVWAVRAKALIP